LPRGVEDSQDRLTNRDLKYKLIVHAERNALLFARGSIKGCAIYTYPMLPCAVCASMVIQSGIKKVVAPVSDNPRWQEDIALSIQLFGEAGVQVELIEGFE
jgi:dCMP deaminase